MTHMPTDGFGRYMPLPQYKMSDIEPPARDDFEPTKAERRARKKANKSKMVVDSAGLKTLTIVVKSKKKKHK